MFMRPKSGGPGVRALAAAGALWIALVPAALARDLVVTFLDCGQGDAAVLQTPSGRTVLIDAGPVEQEGFDAGRDVVAPFLKEAGIRRVDHAVFSHAHLDHIGGFLHLLENFPFGRVYDPGYSYPSPDYKKALELIQQQGVDYSVVRGGSKLDWDPQLKVQVLSPPTMLPWDDPNDNSLVIRVDHGKVSFLFTGDMEEQAEYELVIRQGPMLKAQVLKVGHHGSNTSSKEEFLDHVKPETAVISCGRQNRFRHPNKKVLGRFEELGVKVFRTDLQGHVRVISNGKKYRVETAGPNPVR